MSISNIPRFNVAAPVLGPEKTRQVLPGNNVPSADTASGVEETSAPQRSSAIQEFLDFMKQTPEEKIMEMWLSQHGVSKEEFDAMSAEDKQALLAKMREELKQKMEETAKAASPGDIVDILA